MQAESCNDNGEGKGRGMLRGVGPYRKTSSRVCEFGGKAGEKDCPFSCRVTLAKGEMQ